jgi:hypothetical protein
MTTYAKEVFDQVVNLKPGQSVLIKALSRGHMNSLRVLLGRERKRFLESVRPDFDIVVATKIIGNNFHVVVTKTSKMEAPIVLSETGEVLGAIDLDKPPEILEPVDPPEEGQQDKKRLAVLMRQDGFSEEEIADYLQEDEAEDLTIKEGEE